MKTIRKILSVLLFLSALIIPAKSQINHSFFSNYTIKEGLTDNIIHCLCQDSKGWFWLGTSFGVVRFDGYSFKKFDINTQESSVLGKSLIRTIMEDSRGDIWIGTENHGIFVYNRKECSLQQIKKQGDFSELCCNSIWCILEDRESNIWIGTEKGLNRLNRKDMTLSTFNDDIKGEYHLHDNFVRAMRFDHKGNLWIGTNHGIVLFDFLNHRSRYYLNQPTAIDRENEVWEIFEDSGHQIWAGTYLGGMKRLNERNNAFEDIALEKNNVRANTVRSIVQDRKDNLWIGTRGGMYRIEKATNTIQYFEHNDLDEHSLGHNSVIDLILDKRGDLWAGTRNGISHMNFDKQAFGNISSNKFAGQALSHGEVYALWEGYQDDIWIGTENGGINIINFKTNEIDYITREDGLSNNCIKALCYDGNENLLIGTYLGGMNIMNLRTGKISQLSHDPHDNSSLSDNAVWVIEKDSRGRFWVGTDDGLDLFDPSSRTFTRLGSKYDLGNVLMIYEDKKGRIWAYSENQKLTMINPDGKTRNFPFKSRTMCDGTGDELWIGTLGNGLVRFNPENNESRSYTIEQGLCNNIIYGIINIDNRYLWISTINGISRFDIQKEEFKNYYRSDGLLNSQYHYGAYLTEDNNTLVFGGSKGVDFIFLDQLNENLFIPPIVFTDFRIFNEPVPLLPGQIVKNTLPNLISETEHIILDYHQNMISFEFAALNFSNSEKNEYQYMLEGFDRNWNKIGNQRKATYTNLDPGDYVLKVIGSNNDKLYNTAGASMKITVLPPFWKTIWFRIMLILALAALSYAVVVFVANREKLRSQLIFERKSAQKVKELERLKHQFFMNISHEIRTPLSLILGPLERLIKTDMPRQETLSHLDLIHRNTVNLKKLVNQLLDYRRLETGNVKLEMKRGNIIAFLQEIYATFEKYAEERHIQTSFTATRKELTVLFDADKLEKIVNNLMSNALKYTPDEGKVSLSVSQVLADDVDDQLNYIPPFEKNENSEKQFIQIVVKDSGIGIPDALIGKIFNRFMQVNNSVDKKIAGTGIGLSIAKELVILHRGHVHVRSKEGKGTRFTLLIPLIEELQDKYGSPGTNQASMEVKSDAPLVTASSRAAPNNDSQQPILLVVDDIQDIRTFISYHFESSYLVVSARDGKEGWEKALEIIPDVIIADIMMPVMDGKEFCRKIKKDERTSHIPLVMLTALNSSENQMAGLDAGADDYIVKPFDISLLKARIDNLISIRKGLRERYSREMLLQPKNVMLTSPDEKFLKKVIQVIEKNLDDAEFDVDKMAVLIGVSRTQLYRKIAALTNMTAKEFVRDIRLKRAAQLIVQDKLTISEIALQTGFNDISYFRKCFKDSFGMNASDYLKKHACTSETHDVY